MKFLAQGNNSNTKVATPVNLEPFDYQAGAPTTLLSCLSHTDTDTDTHMHISYKNTYTHTHTQVSASSRLRYTSKQQTIYYHHSLHTYRCFWSGINKYRFSCCSHDNICSKNRHHLRQSLPNATCTALINCKQEQIP